MLPCRFVDRYSDCILLYQNDEVLRRLEKQSRRDEGSRVSFSGMNKYIANSLAGLFLPTDTLRAKW